jgi:hypothetical protein
MTNFNDAITPVAHLTRLLKAAADAHHNYEAALGHQDANWPEWYAQWIVDHDSEPTPAIAHAFDEPDRLDDPAKPLNVLSAIAFPVIYFLILAALAFIVAAL